MSITKIQECFGHIVKYWSLELYKKCQQDWEQIQQFIIQPDDKTFQKALECPGCGTRWDRKYFLVNDVDGICPNCDTWCQPFLCNPINFQSVLKYIDPRYHEYLLPNDLHYCNGCFTMDLETDNTCDFCDIAYCVLCLPDELSFHKCDTCGLRWCYRNGKYPCPKIEPGTGCQECGH